MQRLRFDHDSPVPVDRVFAYLTEHEHLGPLFGARVERVKDGDDGHRNGVGSVRRLRVPAVALAPPFEVTVTEFVPGELVRFRITKGCPVRDHEGWMRFSSQPGGGTHVHYEISFRGVLPGIDRVVALGLKRNVARGLKAVDTQA